MSIQYSLLLLTQRVFLFKGIDDLANKESNRILEMQKILKQIGIKSISSKDFKIFGKE